jgi:CheY-like chemotaxis protein
MSPARRDDFYRETHAVEKTLSDKIARARILVVENCRVTAESTAKLLGLLGHETCIVRDGHQAVAAALSWQPEFILLDLGLPSMDGYEVAQQIRQHSSCRDIVIIAVTGYGQKTDIERSRAAGIDHHLLKPVAPSVLLPLLSRSRSGCASTGFEASVSSVGGSLAGGRPIK